MKKILFPTDFSKAAEHAFIYALKIADQFGASVTVLHAYNLINAVDLYAPYNLDELYEQLKESKFENYKDAVKPLKQIAEENGLDHVEQYYVMEEGVVLEAILRIAERDNIDMIVLGTTGAYGFKEVFKGSVAGELLENAPCKVLAVPEEAVFDGVIDNIGFTTSYKEEEKKALLDLEQWSKTFNAQIHVVNVDLAHTEFYLNRMDELEEEFADHDHLNFSVVEGTDLMEALTNFLEDQQIDILAMVTHKRNFLQELFHYSRAKVLSYHSKTPILSLPDSLIKG